MLDDLVKKADENMADGESNTIDRYENSVISGTVYPEDRQENSRESLSYDNVSNIVYNADNSQGGKEEADRYTNSYVEPPTRNYTYDTNQYYQPGQDTTNTSHKKKNSNIGKKVVGLVCSAVLFGLVAGGTFQGLNYLAGKATATETDSSSETAAMEKSVTTNSGTTKVTNINTSAEGATVAEVANSAMPSIVSISSKSVAEVQGYFFGSGTQLYESESSASGIIVGQNDTELLIATNNHVVENTNTLTVAFVDGAAISAQIKGTDADNDLAVIAVKVEDLKTETMEAIKIAQLGDSAALVVGEQLVAIGNALGYGQSVTTGIVSALDRTIQNSNGSYRSYIQTDAAINPGNSGGALLNMAGQVIGINTAKASDTKVEGMGYAIPISNARSIIEELMNETTRELVDEANQGVLGIKGVSVTSDVSEIYNMPVGIRIMEITEGSAADEKGLAVYDILTKLDGKKISSIESLKNKLQYYAAGETVSITFEREEKGEYVENTIELVLKGKGSTTTETENTQPEIQDGSVQVNPFSR